MASKVGQYFTRKGLISEEVIVYEEIKPFQVKY